MFSFSHVCVLCLSTYKNIQSVFTEKNEEILFLKKLKYCLPEIDINFSTEIPKYMCRNCTSKLECLYTFKETCLRNNTYLKRYFQITPADESYKNLSEKLADITYKVLNSNKTMATVGSDELRIGKENESFNEEAENKIKSADVMDIEQSYLLFEEKENINVKEKLLTSEDNIDAKFHHKFVKCESISSATDVSVPRIEDIVHEDSKYCYSNKENNSIKPKGKKVTERGNKQLGFDKLESIMFSKFETLFGEIPSDNESNVDTDEEDIEDLSVLEQIQDNSNEEESLQALDNEIEANVHDENKNNIDKYISEGELSKIHRNLPFDTDNIKWDSTNTSSNLNSFTKTSGPKNIPVDANTPFDIFSCLFTEELVSHITEQTNLYALQKYGDPVKFKMTTNDEIKIFLGINIFMGIKRLPFIKDYWSSNEEIRDIYISSLMSRNRFMWLLGTIHLNNNENQSKKDEPNFDKLYKVRPFLNKLLETYKYYYEPDEHQSIDESLIKFKSRSSLQRTQKSIKRGYKVWVRADKSGYISEFQICTRKVDASGTRVVKDLTKNISGNYHKVFFNNCFTSMHLMNELKESKIYSCGTVHKDQKGLPDLKGVKVMKQGAADWRMTDKGIVCMKWMDKKEMYFLSNFHDPEKTTSIQRKLKDGTSKKIMYPGLVEDYNQNMGHVANADMLKSLYEINRRSKRWWLSIFWHFIDVTVVNAFILFQKKSTNRSVELKEFRMAVARGLIGIPKGEKRKRKSDEFDFSNKTFRRQVPAEIRYREASHMPVYGTSLRCRFCSTKNEPHRTKWCCTVCKVGLCLNNKKNCFVNYHQN